MGQAGTALALLLQITTPTPISVSAWCSMPGVCATIMILVSAEVAALEDFHQRLL